MLQKIGKAVFSFSGTSLFIAVIGVMSSFVGLFVDVSGALSVKWLLFTITVAAYAIVILLKIAHDAVEQGRPPPAFENPIKYLKDGRIFVIRKNDHFLANIVVGCYSQQDGIDRLAYLGVVDLVQPKIIQIKIEVDLGVLRTVPVGPDELKMLEIRPVVPFSALLKFTDMRKN
ncbi:hypothetical protein [Pseudomonas sp. W5-01]|uniref:hypothetical protein n=1 Tax=Pseudomonas sp. W5-01 TaxID=3097454 RepID=UPI00397E34CA